MHLVHKEKVQNDDSEAECDGSPVPPPPPPSRDASVSENSSEVHVQYTVSKDAMKAEESLHLISKLEKHYVLNLCAVHDFVLYR